MTINSRIVSIAALVCVFGGIGCAASLPPQDLLDARSAFDNASRGPAGKLDPADLHNAKQQLDVAETAFREDGDTPETRDQAYVAIRKAQFADSVGRTRALDQAKRAVVTDMHADEKEAVANTAAELGRTKAELDARGTMLATQGAALEEEKTKRADAEQRANKAAAELARLGTVTHEQRGMVITLSGSVLFASAKSDLLPAAQAKLSEVAAALTEVDPLSKMVVEGHSDSQGAAAYNQDLSQRRAQAVRDYLVTRGIASDRISAQGFGASRPIADNASPDGRANNRRVEIVVQQTEPVALRQ
ncbi:MAG TPA: OmpA family protein [Polyangiaceae bacterium]|jgi:outer membrane protein OmpA-like peptidoglycan-associated protein|nr:OmpA family protein [Polyangiaceae bacterium]